MKNKPRIQGKDLHLCTCSTCSKLNVIDSKECIRCQTPLAFRDESSLYKSWALLITAAILLFPANIYPITMLTNQGKIAHETIFSGIANLVKSDLLPIAVIVFIASILIPWLKIIGLALYLSAITFNLKIPKRPLMIGYHIIELIGRWSMLDLFVISMTVSLINMGQLLDAKPAPAATAFALVILFTQLSAKVLDTRLLWDQLEKKPNGN